MSKIKHGDRVTWTHRMYRHVHMYGNRKTWERTSWDSPGKGIFLGWRTKQDGKVVYGNDEDGAYFEREGSVRTAMVSQGPANNPIYVSPEGLEKDEQDPA